MERSVLRKILREQNTILLIKLNPNDGTNNKIDIQCAYKAAGWQSGYAAACKAVNSGSIPDSASINKINNFYLFNLKCLYNTHF